MASPFVQQEKIEAKRSTRIWAFCQINRLQETIGYNITYVLLAIAIAHTDRSLAYETSEIFYIGVIFGAVMLTKMQASVADVLHDYIVDKENPGKRQNTRAVDQIGYETALSVLVIELSVGIFLWSLLSIRTQSLLFVICGLLFTICGFIYSYPPRIKERGISNHIVTSGTDVLFVVFPLTELLGGIQINYLAITLLIVFFYVFGYHILHQAADTHYDRQSGIQTFTQDIGVQNSVLLSIVCTTAAGIGAMILQASIGAFSIFLVSIGYMYIYQRIKNQSEKSQTDIIANIFNIKQVATFLNAAFALSLFM